MSCEMPDMLNHITSVYPKLKVELVQVWHEVKQEFLRNYKIGLVITRAKNLPHRQFEDQW